MKKTIYMVRHGQTLFNELRRVQGWCDSPLTKLGIKQALDAKKYFEDNNIVFDHCYSSTSERCSDTLELITDLPYKRLKGLKERGFGKFEGTSEDLNPPLALYDSFFEIYGGETSDQVRKRLVDTMNEIANEDNEVSLAVSHGGACYHFLWCVVNDEQKFKEISKGGFPNCCIFKYTYEDGKFNFEEVIRQN